MKIKQVERAETEFKQAVSEDNLITALTDNLKSEKLIEVSEIDSGLFNSTYLVVASQNKHVLKVSPAENTDVFYNE